MGQGGLTVRRDIRARLAAVHGSAGALFGAMLFVVLFTGAWSAAQPAMAGWWRAPRAADAGAALPLDRLLALAASRGFDATQARIALPRPGDPAARFCAGRDCSLALDARTGDRIPASSPADVLVTLHKSLYAGFPGRIAVSLFGVVLLLLLAGGVALHGPSLRHAFRLRGGRGRYVRLFDLHGLVGLWAIPWLALFGATGALSGLGALGTVALAPVAFPAEPGQAMVRLMGTPAPPATGRPWLAAPSLDEILRRDAARGAEFRPQALVLHHWGDAGASVEVAGVTRGLPSTALFERHLYRASDGAWLRDETVRGRGPWLRAFVEVQPLHFAQYEWLPGAAAWRAVHVLMGVAACVLAATGLYLWIRRHGSQRPRQARALARAATAACAGLVLAAGVLLAAGQAWPSPMRPAAWASGAFWAAWVAAVAMVLACPRPEAGLRILLAGAGIAWLSGALLHLWREVGAGMGHWPIDAALALIGAALLRQAWILARAPAGRSSRGVALP